jgi:hypothetical protein
MVTIISLNATFLSQKIFAKWFLLFGLATAVAKTTWLAATASTSEKLRIT